MSEANLEIRDVVCRKFDSDLQIRQDTALTGKPLTRFCKPHTSATKSVSPVGRDESRSDLPSRQEDKRIQHDNREEYIVQSKNRRSFFMTNSETQRNEQFIAPKAAFTLAEVLITLGIIGVVAALTLPSMITNIQERVKKEQVRTVKYKLTLATDKMKSLDKIGGYSTGANDTEVTAKFINELKNHFKIAKVCQNNDLRSCWPTDKISTPDGEVSVSSLTNGTQLKALALGTANTKTMGIVTGDGTPMILLYSPVCTPLDPAKTYTWSMIDNKPETNATTNCISAIFDINGAKKPNKLGSDVRTINSLFGTKITGSWNPYPPTAINKDQCEQLRKKHLVNECSYDTDYYAGAVKVCNDIGLHLPSLQTLAVIAGAKYGISNVGPNTIITITTYTKDDFQQKDASDFIWIDGSGIPNGANSAVSDLSGYFWASPEMSATTAWKRYIPLSASHWLWGNRDDDQVAPLCVGD